MPRHPPCALQHFTHNKHAQTTKPDTKKMLASTMQHSTHHHTPTPQPPPHPTNKRDALDGQGRKRPPRKPPPTGRCLLRTQQCAEPVHVFWRHVPPSHTP